MRRVGVYVDASNIGMNGGHGMRYDVLRNLACRGGGEPQRLNVYLAYDERRAEQFPEYGQKARSYQTALRAQGFRVAVKPVKHYIEEGVETAKSNADLDMAVDLLTESERLDTVLLATGDGDFVRVIRALQSKGCRVEVLAFDNVSRELREACDQFVSGYLIPNLLPARDTGPGRPRWGEIGARMRGVCTKLELEQGFGFLTYWTELPTTSILAASDTRQAYFKTRDLVESGARLTSGAIVEFELAPAAKPGKAPEATNLQMLQAYRQEAVSGSVAQPVVSSGA